MRSTIGSLPILLARISSYAFASVVPGFAVSSFFCITSRSFAAFIGANFMSDDVIIPTRRSSESRTGKPLNLILCSNL